MIITNDRMTAGTEAVGAIAEGKNFSSVYVGIAPDYNKDGLETPSILEVSASVYAAILYIYKHPCEGIMLPEYLDVSEILSHTERFLPVISKRI
jgi:homospermidine synthase